MDENTINGYAGKILKVNLTDGTIEEYSSYKYLPEYIGGRMLCHRLFWEYSNPGIHAFDPENVMIFANGPTTGTGLPTGGRCVMASISPNALPEQYAHGSVGGDIGTELKYAGYDALIIVGRAPEKSYLLIEDNKVSIRGAEMIWGMTVHITQRALSLAHGKDAVSMVIGPAGENLCRNATVTTSMDHALSKTGFGAVFGSKNLKGIVIHRTGTVRPGNIQKLLELRRTVGYPKLIPNPIEPQKTMCGGQDMFDAEWDLGKFACSPGCNARCQRTIMNQDSVLTGEKIDQLEKCVSPYVANLKYDIDFPVWLFVSSKKNNLHMELLKSFPRPMDKTDPDWDVMGESLPGDRLDFFGPSFERSIVVNQLCNEYGFDKWDFGIWYLSWIAMAKKEGIIEDFNFGMEPDVDNMEFIRKFFLDIVYRRGIGEVFAEGMARAIRYFGKEKYGDAIYHGRYNYKGERLDLPLSVETGWGHCMHWTGRGYQGTPKWLWVSNTLCLMTNTRDAACSAHIHVPPEAVREFRKSNPSYSQLLIDLTIKNEILSVMKDSVTTCEWVAPDVFWPTLESELFNAATGNDNFTPDDLYEACDRGRMLFRAILIRDFERDRDLEVETVYPNITYPDPNGEVGNWEEWNDTVDLYYKANSWDLKTGWPYRSTWERYNLAFVADELERNGKIPPEGREEYIRKPNPFHR